jgi:hypothetical protein
MFLNPIYKNLFWSNDCGWSLADSRLPIEILIASIHKIYDKPKPSLPEFKKLF